MSAPNENPFDRYGIDPREGPEGITERMRELIEDAPDEATRDAVRAAWEALTRDPRGRAHWALRTHPRSTRSVPRRPVRQRATGVGATPEPRDYVGAPSLEATLDTLLGGPRQVRADMDPPLDEDPVLVGRDSNDES